MATREGGLFYLITGESWINQGVKGPSARADLAHPPEASRARENLAQVAIGQVETVGLGARPQGEMTAKSARILGRSLTFR